MKLKDLVMEAVSSKEVEAALLQAYKADPIFPATEDSEYEFDDEEYADFMQTVDEVVAFATQHKITSAQAAVEQYINSIRDGYLNATGIHKH